MASLLQFLMTELTLFTFEPWHVIGTIFVLFQTVGTPKIYSAAWGLQVMLCESWWLTIAHEDEGFVRADSRWTFR